MPTLVLAPQHTCFYAVRGVIDHGPGLEATVQRLVALLV